MKISARIHSQRNQHQVFVQTNDSAQQMRIEPKISGFGSSVNGGELLLLSLATCFCNDIYREAAKRDMVISSVEVEVTGDFGAEGEPGTNFSYKAHVAADASAAAIQDLINHTDKVAEVHNTLRKGLSIALLH